MDGQGDVSVQALRREEGSHEECDLPQVIN